MPTREYIHAAWITVSAQWARFADWSDCFRARMELLNRLQSDYPAYAQALAATTGEAYVRFVSKSWSTDPARAGKVLSVYDAHRLAFSA